MRISTVKSYTAYQSRPIQVDLINKILGFKISTFNNIIYRFVQQLCMSKAFELLLRRPKHSAQNTFWFMNSFKNTCITNDLIVLLFTTVLLNISNLQALQNAAMMNTINNTSFFQPFGSMK